MAKIWCAECDKEVEPKDGRCPDCNLNLSAVMERLREEDAAAKYRKKAGEKPKGEGGEKEIRLPPWLRKEEKK